METKTLYQYIIENLDTEDEYFTQETLPDDPHPSVLRPLGTEEAFWLAADFPSRVEVAASLCKLLQTYKQNANPLLMQEIYHFVQDQPVIVITEPLCDMLHSEEFTEALYTLGRSLFYNARHRGPLKLGYILLGFYGVERIQKEFPELWVDMIHIAQCEEFTYYFLLACSITDYKPLRAIWRLLGCTKGWGRVFCIKAAECEDEAQELWLIQYGMDNTVEYPSLAAFILHSSNLAKHLEQEEVSYPVFVGAMKIVTSFLHWINTNTDVELEQQLVDVPGFSLAKLLQNLLRQARKHAAKPEEILWVLRLSYALHCLLENETLCLIGANDMELLLASCDSIAYAQDWREYVYKHLVNEDVLNYDLCDFACDMDIPISQPLFAYLEQHPLEFLTLPYLFACYDEQIQQRALRFVEEHLESYRTEETALLIPLRYLERHPGLGESIIISALTSIYDTPRGVACDTLNAWEFATITEPLWQALRTAKALSNNVAVTERIKRLLEGRHFSEDDLI